MKIREKINAVIPAVMVPILGIGLLLYRESVSQEIRNALTMCGEILIPSMFPFMALSAFAINSRAFNIAEKIFAPVMNKFFALPGKCFSAVFLGFTGGYPVGAKIITELYENGDISQNEARRMFTFCINAGPAFVVSAAGGSMLGSQKAGYIMLLAMFIASILTGILSSFFACKKNTERYSRKKKTDISASVTLAVSSALQSTMNICAWVLFFAAITGIVEPNIKNDTTKALFEIFSEVTSGVIPAFRLGGLPLAAAAISFGGICVMCQVFPMIKKCGIKAKEYLLFRTVNSVIVFFVSKILFNMPFAEISVSAAANQMRLFTHSAPASASLLIMGAVFILSVSKSSDVNCQFASEKTFSLCISPFHLLYTCCHSPATNKQGK